MLVTILRELGSRNGSDHRGTGNSALYFYGAHLGHLRSEDIEIWVGNAAAAVCWSVQEGMQQCQDRGGPTECSGFL